MRNRVCPACGGQSFYLQRRKDEAKLALLAGASLAWVGAAVWWPAYILAAGCAVVTLWFWLTPRRTCTTCGAWVHGRVGDRREREK